MLGALAVALLIGVAGGAVLAAFAGARRTDNAIGRFMDDTNEADVMMFPFDFRDSERLDAADVAQMPGVARAGSALGYLLATRTPDGQIQMAENADALASEDGVGLYEVGGAALLEGRMPRQDRVDEAYVNDVAARDYDLRIGSTLPIAVARFDDLLALGEDAGPEQFSALFQPIDVRVVGIGRNSDQLLSNESQERGVVALSPAFAREFNDHATFRVVAADLDSPDDTNRFQAALSRRYIDIPMNVSFRSAKEATFDRVVQPYADALRLFGAAAALTGLLVVAQALARLVRADAADGRTLNALGATRRQRASASGVRALVSVAVGAVLAVLIAIVASPLFPIGPARQAVLDSGVSVDGLVLGAGAVALTALLAAAVAWTAWRRSRVEISGVAQRDAVDRPSLAVDRLARAGAPMSALAGVRFALERDRAHGSAPLATTLFGLVVAITTVGAALTFGTNLDRLVTTPERYGWSWDTLIDPGDEGADDELKAEVRNDDALASATMGTRAVTSIGDISVPSYGFERLRGRTELTVLEGHLPVREDEVALGAQTLRDLDSRVGDTVTAQAADGTRIPLRIVGRTMFPSISLNATYGLAEGAAFTTEGLRALEPNADPSFFLVDVREGTSLSSVREHYGEGLDVDGVNQPGDIESYAQIRVTPIVLAGLLAVLGIGVLAHLLVTSIRARRRDLAVIKTLGASRRQLASAVAWQATTLVTVALIVGVPLGAVGGLLVWRAFADGLGIDEAVSIPVLAFVGIVVIGVVLANLIALAPGRTAARTPAATVLALHDD